MAINYYRIIKVYVQSNKHYKVHVLYTYNVLAAGSELTASVRYEAICKDWETTASEDGFENSPC